MAGIGNICGINSCGVNGVSTYYNLDMHFNSSNEGQGYLVTVRVSVMARAIRLFGCLAF